MSCLGQPVSSKGITLNPKPYGINIEGLDMPGTQLPQPRLTCKRNPKVLSATFKARDGNQTGCSSLRLFLSCVGILEKKKAALLTHAFRSDRCGSHQCHLIL